MGAAACLLTSSVFVAAQAQGADATDFFAAVAAMEEGRYADALRALDRTASSPETLYLRARAEGALDQPALALSHAPLCPDSWPHAVCEELSALKAEWAAAAGRCEELAKLVSSVPAARAERLHAECAFAAGDLGQAAQRLANARDLAGRTLLVDAWAGSGKTAEAKALARELWLSAPASPHAARWAQLAELGDKPVLSFEESLLRSNAWLEARRFEEAARELAVVAEPEQRGDAARLWHARGEALFRTRSNYPEASSAFGRAAKLQGSTEAYDAFHAVRARSRAGDDRAAIRGYEKFARQYPKSRLAGDALYLAAWLKARANAKDAAAALSQFVRSPSAREQPSLLRDALWDLAWLALERRNGNEARRWLEQVPRDADPLERARVAYWRARALDLEKKRSEAARHAFREVLDIDPLGYYAQLAARWLHRIEGAWPKLAATNTPFAKPAIQPPPELDFYRRLGLLTDAARAAERAGKDVRDVRARLALAIESGSAAHTHAAASPLLSELFTISPEGDARWAWEAAFPRPYVAAVTQATKAHHVPAELLYGHMQIESRYKPRAVSGADAMGLLQLLPRTAEKVAARVGLEASRDALLLPATNITLGAAFLGQLLTHYKSQVPLAIAAYNAGTARVDSWVSTKAVPLDVWVERIGIEQTRNYVRRVISAWSRYHYMASPAEPWDLPLPAEVRRP